MKTRSTKVKNTRKSKVNKELLTFLSGESPTPGKVDPLVPHYVSPVKVGTVVLRDGVAEMINSVPLVRGGTLLLISPGDPREVRIQDFLDDIHRGDLDVLWDPERSVVPESGEDYLQGNGFIDDDGNVGE